MKITQKLEWDYEESKVTSTNFMTRDTIKDVVAAELFIPIVEELYDKNIFTNWSGLTGNAHIRIPLDGLSKENFLIAKQNCENNPNHWVLQRPPYEDIKNLLPKYTFEIYVDYEEELTEVSDVVDKLLNEVRKFSFQDVQIAREEYAKESQLPRVDIKGLYKKSECSVFNIEKQEDEMIPAESFEELSEMYLEGDNPEYFYDEETDTYFRNKELIAKSKEYREYEVSPEKRKERAIDEISKMINSEMTDEEKYKVIFDWCVNYFNYAYSGLNYAYAEKEWRKESNENLTKYYRIYCRNSNLQCKLLGLESRKKFLEDSKNNSDIPNEAIVRTQKIIEHLEECEKCKQKEKGFMSGNTDSVWLSKYGVCMNFAEIYEFLCGKFSLPCKYIQGSIDSGEYNVGHAWNAIMINGKLKYVDISSAIHCKDKSNTVNLPEDFFGKTFEELQTIDGGKNRRIAEGFEKDIKELINSSEGWNVGD